VCETWSVTLREGNRLKVFENRVLRRKFGPKRDEVKGERRKLHKGSFIICTHPQISLGRSNQGERGGWGMWHARERRENCTRFWWESSKERNHLKDQGLDGRMGSKRIFGRFAGRVWT
jgi:hypothetical protein